jgi:hypothetical protein
MIPYKYVGEVAPDDCTCRLVNFSDYSGWYMRSRNPSCPHHGYGAVVAVLDKSRAGNEPARLVTPDEGDAHE